MFAASGGTTSSEFIIFPHSPTPTQSPHHTWLLNWVVSGPILGRFSARKRNRPQLPEGQELGLCLSSPDGHDRFDQQRTWAKLRNRRDGPIALWSLLLE
jgi:hypothetical protein